MSDLDEVERLRRDMRELAEARERVADAIAADLDALDARVSELEKDAATLFGRGGEGRLSIMEGTLRKHASEIEALRIFQWKIVGATTIAGILVGLVTTLIAKFW